MKSCLIVDDSRVVRKVAARIAADMGFSCREAGDGDEAFEMCSSDMPDAIILDWNMPVMSGLEFLGALRLANLDRKPFVVYCTTENDPVEISKAIAAGADEYMLKPFDRDTIESKLSAAGLA